MIDDFSFDSFLQLMDAERAAIVQSLFEEVVIKKGTVMLPEGKVCTKTFVIKHGVARKYFKHFEREVTTEIYLNGDLAFSFESFTFQRPAKEFIAAVTDVSCLAISYSDYVQAKKEYNWFVEYDLMLVERYTLQLELKLKELATLSGAERYEKILRQYPQLIQQVPLKIIASYLNVSPERLSRIRARI